MLLNGNDIIINICIISYNFVYAYPFENRVEKGFSSRETMFSFGK